MCVTLLRRGRDGHAWARVHMYGAPRHAHEPHGSNALGTVANAHPTICPQGRAPSSPAACLCCCSGYAAPISTRGAPCAPLCLPACPKARLSMWRWPAPRGAPLPPFQSAGTTCPPAPAAALQAGRQAGNACSIATRIGAIYKARKVHRYIHPHAATAALQHTRGLGTYLGA